MQTPPCILVVDDQPQNVEILKTRLAINGYNILTATSGPEALSIVTSQPPDLMLLDVLMPEMDGLEVCRRIKADDSLPFIPIIMVTVKSETQNIVDGFEAGADDYLTKPLDQAVLGPRIESMLRLKAQQDEAQNRITQLEAETLQLRDWYERLHQQLETQAADLERLGELKQFVPQQLAELVMARDGKKWREEGRQEVTILCCSLEGLTTLVEMEESDCITEMLADYYQVLGRLTERFEGNLDPFEGDQFTVVFNGSLPCSNPELQAVQMAIATQQEFIMLAEKWQQGHRRIDFGIGIARGHVVFSKLHFEGRADYAMIGPVRALASHLSQTALGGKIFASQPILEVVHTHVKVSPASGIDLMEQDISSNIGEIIALSAPESP